MNNNKEKSLSHIATRGIESILEHKRDTRPCDLFRLIAGLPGKARNTIKAAHSSSVSRCLSGLPAGRALLPG